MANEKRGATIVPGMRYKDAPAAVEWLCNVFGFEKKLVVPGPDNTVAHAELTFGNGMVMLGSAEKEDRGKETPELKIGGMETSIYVIVSDVDGHYARAKAAGAKIIAELEDKGYGGKGYACRDLDGHIWHFGSYDPWEETKKHVSYGFGTVRPYLYGPLELDAFVKNTFDAKELHRTAFPNGFHLEMQIEDSVVVLETGNPPPHADKQGSIYVYVPNVDETYKKAIKNGATPVNAPEDKPYGERGAGVKDSYGNTWWIATRLEAIQKS